jgi:hypothetical protein
MSTFSKRTVITLACGAALGALTVTPGLAGVVTPTDKMAVSTASPIDSVHYRYGWCHHRHYWHPWRTTWAYPYYGWGGYPYWGWSYPGVVGAATSAGAGLLGLGLGIL